MFKNGPIVCKSCDLEKKEKEKHDPLMKNFMGFLSYFQYFFVCFGTASLLPKKRI